LLTQLKQFMQALTPDQYLSTSPKLQCGSIGAHVRHILDHYLSLLSAQNSMDYDRRERSQAIEQDVWLATDMLDSITHQLQSLNQDRALMIRSSTNLEYRPEAVSSSLARELNFLYSHTTHHMAIVRLLAIHMGIRVNSDFGKAVSTKKYELNVQS